MVLGANDLDACLLGNHVLCEDACAGVGVVAADDDDGVDPQRLAVGDDLVKLFRLLEFCASEQIMSNPPVFL